ncbi:unnamed protein product [Schistosoma rodhaini]|uniref:Ion transport domain-containing protein n=1 Tax=Schistosoma rodhaini TaxID=6188 RepID=A0AA85EKE5_9TREM|nr:unnamed protein product [Schistosoma rodhaini]
MPKIETVFLEFMKGILAASFNNGMVEFWQYCTELESPKYWSHVQRSNLTSNQNLCNYIDDCGLYSSTNTLVERTPETSWYSQPSTFWLNEEDEPFSVSEDLKSHSHLLAWDCQQEKLAITLVPHQSKEKPYESQSTQTKSSVYILQRQSPQTHFYGYGCAVVQTGPRSLAVFTAISEKHVNKTNLSSSENVSTINNITENKTGNINMIKDENSANCRGSFIIKSKQLENRKDINQNSTGFISQDNYSLCEHEIQVEDQIKAVYCTQEHVAYWNGHHIFVYKQSSKGYITHLTSFSCEFKLVGMHQYNLFTIEPYKLQVVKLIELSLLLVSHQMLHISQFRMTIWNIVRLSNILLLTRTTRLIVLFPWTRLVVSVLADLPSNLTPVLGILISAFYFYALLGMNLFHDVIKYDNSTNSSNTQIYQCGTYQELQYWSIHFNDFAASLVLLWDLMVVNNWQIIVFAYQQAVNRWVHIYMISWWLFVVVGILNLTTAFIIESFLHRRDLQPDISAFQNQPLEVMRNTTTNFQESLGHSSNQACSSHHHNVESDEDEASKYKSTHLLVSSLSFLRRRSSTEMIPITLDEIFRCKLKEPSEESIIAEIYSHPHFRNFVAL